MSTQRNGRRVITADLATELTRLLRCGDGPVKAVAASGDGLLIAVACRAGLAVFDSRDWDQYYSVDTRAPVHCVAFDPSGFTRVAWVEKAVDGALELVWCELPSDELHRAPLDSSAPDRVHFHPDGSRLFMAGRSHQIYDLDGRRRLRQAVGPAHTADYSSDGARLAIAYEGGRIHVVDTISSEIIHRCRVDGEPDLESLRFSPDAKWLAANHGERITAIELASGEQHLIATSSANDALFDPTSTHLAVASTEVTIWNLRDLCQVATHSGDGQIFNLAYHPDGTSLYGVVHKANCQSLIEWKDGRAKTRMTGDMRPPPAVVFHSAPSDVGYEWSYQHRPHLSGGLEPGCEIQGAARVPVPRALPHGAAPAPRPDRSPGPAPVFDPGAALVAAPCGEHEIGVWRLADAHLLGVLEHQRASALAFSACGQLLAIGSFDRKLALWQVDPLRRLVELYAHTGEVSAIAFCPDGTLMATSGSDGSVKIWALPAPPTDKYDDLPDYLL